ncbi:glycosyltransferase family 4 protein [Actinacidiphila sp. bgisy167]|uniref:glycosyltransferase family 4 protein n=1 Tax=Actinacidiphila sp. bgisy167 TaxID=3413797 RepID=UPI003D743326
MSGPARPAAPAPAGAAPAYAVLPGDVDDATTPSGGNVYDRRLSQSLAAAGRPLRELAVRGAWPYPDSASRQALARALAAVPDGAAVLLDGLVACGVPEVVVPHTHRLRTAVLVHLPLADETGLDPAAARALDALERRTLRAAAAVVTTSPWAARRIAERHALPAGRVHTVVPCTDPAPLASGTDGGTRLLCVASLTPRKGHDVLAEALAAVADRPWTCRCVGPYGRSGEHLARVRELIGRYGLGDRVHLTGPLTGESLAAEYAAADLLVLPSRAETYGMVVTEALMRGTPVLATTAGGVPDALGLAPDGTPPGVLVPPGDAAALAAALRRWLDDAGARGRLRAAARLRRATLRGWEHAAREMATVLELLREGTR